MEFSGAAVTAEKIGPPTVLCSSASLRWVNLHPADRIAFERSRSFSLLDVQILLRRSAEFLGTTLAAEKIAPPTVLSPRASLRRVNLHPADGVAFECTFLFRRFRRFHYSRQPLAS
jgi:hypothetical protein